MASSCSRMRSWHICFILSDARFNGKRRRIQNTQAFNPKISRCCLFGAAPESTRTWKRSRRMGIISLNLSTLHTCRWWWYSQPMRDNRCSVGGCGKALGWRRFILVQIVRWRLSDRNYVHKDCNKKYPPTALILFIYCWFAIVCIGLCSPHWSGFNCD